LGQEARYRIERNFSLPMIVRKYENLYKEVLVGVNIFPDYQELRR
jgi:hypothetical protein